MADLSAAALCRIVEKNSGITTAGDALTHVQAGYERFLAADGTGHVWSFLEASATLSVIEGTSAYDLPADFGGLRVEPVPDWTEMDNPFHELSVERIERMWNDDAWRENTAEDAPGYFAIRVKAFQASVGTRWEMLLAPEPASTYTLYYRYLRVAAELTDSAIVYLMGGSAHSDTLRAAALADWELLKGHNPGPWETRFQRALQASITRDRALFGSQSPISMTGR